MIQKKNNNKIIRNAAAQYTNRLFSNATHLVGEKNSNNNNNNRLFAFIFNLSKI